MSELKFGWHMPSFPVDGSSGPAFIDQIHHTLDRIQPHFDSVWVDDHMMPWAEWQSNDTPYLECLSTIAYFAAAYPRLKFGATVLCQSYRNPGLLAKMAANLQLLTGGRFLFGIGAGWMEEDYRAYNFDFPKAPVRIAQLEEVVQIVRKLWTESPASFEGSYYRIRNAYCEPRPDPVPPLLIGGGGERLTLRVVAKYADWWNISGGNYDNYARKLKVLGQHCAAVGRDYDEIVKTWSAEAVAVAETEAEAGRIAAASPYNQDSITGTPAQVAEQLQAFVDLGVRYFIVRLLDFPNTQGIEMFAREVMPRLSASR
ncbi:MAG: LLM class flavin-dependent oxidoreductase [Anaerolineae bacterium]|jgi:alkanesulfonate monooxygenase SsuD/methylene tetrahydromethanopterin reductase-like flavin-dependent oxidoreductase (luciferase family)